MKHIIFPVISTLLISSSVFARGGAIGGGEVNKFPIFKCAAQSMDPTYPSQVSTLIVNGEADYDGFLISQMSVTIELQDQNGTAVSYLPTTTLPNDFDPVNLEAYQFAQTLPGEANPLIAQMQVNSTEGYLIPAMNSTGVEELKLSDCEYMSVVSQIK